MKVSTAQFGVSTSRRSQMLDITSQVQQALARSGAREGVVHVYVPHTTAGITVNENADPNVARDVLSKLAGLVPHQDDYQHAEGNADAHIKTILTGTSVTLFISGGELQLGEWQGIFLCEFDGPRQREVWLKIISD